MCLLQRGAVPIRGPESLPWVAEQVTQYGGCGARVKVGKERCLSRMLPNRQDRTSRGMIPPVMSGLK